MADPARNTTLDSVRKNSSIDYSSTIDSKNTDYKTKAMVRRIVNKRNTADNFFNKKQNIIKVMHENPDMSYVNDTLKNIELENT